MTCHICKALRNLLEAPPKLRNLCRKYCRTCGTRQAPESAPGPARTAPRSLLWLKTMSFAAGEKPCFPAWLGVFALIFQQSSPPGCRYQLTPCCNALLLHIYVGFLLTKLCWLCLRLTRAQENREVCQVSSLLRQSKSILKCSPLGKLAADCLFLTSADAVEKCTKIEHCASVS